MPSLFPVMDPYVEVGSIWPDMHLRLISNSSEALQSQVRPKYIVRIEERIALETFSKRYVPHVLVIKTTQVSSGTESNAGLLVADEPQTIRSGDEERRIPYLEVILRQSGNVVTVIEVLSPSNKLGLGRADYLQKQEDLLNTGTNLVEIDPLSGPTATFARRFRVTTPQDWRYIISISRSQQRTHVEAYPIPPTARLPRCKVLLLSEEHDAVLDLPAVFTRCYEVGDYSLLLDYRQPPPVALSKAEEDWMEALLVEKGLRTAPAEQ